MNVTPSILPAFLSSLMIPGAKRVESEKLLCAAITPIGRLVETTGERTCQLKQSMGATGTGAFKPRERENRIVDGGRCKLATSFPLPRGFGEC